MTSLAILLLLALTVVVGAVWYRKYGGYMPEPYRGRACKGASWKRAFPGAANDDIRTFLGLFVRAFAFRDTQTLQVEPEDKVIEVYRALYMRTGGVDGLELETFAKYIEKEYKVRLESIWSEALTFGALYLHCHGASAITERER